MLGNYAGRYVDIWRWEVIWKEYRKDVLTNHKEFSLIRGFSNKKYIPPPKKKKKTEHESNIKQTI